MSNKRDKYVDSTTDNFLVRFNSEYALRTFDDVLQWLGTEERYHYPMRAFKELCRQLKSRENGERCLLWVVYQLIEQMEVDAIFIENTRKFFSSCDSRFKQPRVPGSAIGQIQEAYPGAILEQHSLEEQT